MNLANHCELCDHQQTDFKTGTTCGLTNKKPQFNITCPKIQLNTKLEDKLKAVHIQYEHFRRKDLLTKTYFIVLTLIGIAVIIGGYLLGKYIFDKGVISTVPLIIMIVGLTPIGMAIRTLINHQQDLSTAKGKKDRLDEILKSYRIEYDIDVVFGKEIHEHRETHVELNIHKV